MERENIPRLGLILMVICLIAGLALAGAYNATRERVEHQKRLQQLQALKVVLPQAALFFDDQSGGEFNCYTGVDGHGQVVGYAFLGEAKGYSSVIQVMVGVDREGKISGIKITEQKETPGLGDQVDRVPSRQTLWQVLGGGKAAPVAVRPWFQEQFAGKTLSDLKVVNEATGRNIQAITGATITSKAVVRAVREALEAFLDQEGRGKQGGGE